MFRFFYIFIIFSLLVHLNVIHYQFCILAKLCRFIRISHPASTNCNIQDHVKWLIIWCRVCNFTESGSFGKPVLLRKVKYIIHIETDLPRLPFTCIDMIFTGKIALCQFISSLFLRMWFSKMQCPMSCFSIITQYFHNVDFTTFWPLTIKVLICWHHPECRQKTFATWDLSSCLKSSIFVIMFVLCIDSS